MNMFTGMDPDQGRDVGNFIKTSGTQILEGFNNLNGVVNGVDWNGPDADAYREEWNSFVSSLVNDLSALFEDKGNALITQADQQDEASGGSGGSIPA